MSETAVLAIAKTRLASHFGAIVASGLAGRPWAQSKPFACTVLIDPSIDGWVQLASAHGLHAQDIERIDLKVPPPVLEPFGKRTTASGLGTKFGVYHAGVAGTIFSQEAAVPGARETRPTTGTDSNVRDGGSA